MTGRDIIVVGASAGGVEALVQLVGGLPAGLPASVFVVCHFPPTSRSVLPNMLSRAGPLLATHAVDGEPFLPGHIYVAPPDRHLLLTPDSRTRLTRSARENNHRPAADPMFRSAARHYGPRVIGMVLTGAQSDGAAGLLAVRAAGGVAVVQDPHDAVVGAMPQSASNVAGADHIVPLADMARLLVELVREPNGLQLGGAGGMTPQPTDPADRASSTVELTMAAQARGARRGQVSTFTCPECGGALWQIDEPRLIQFRCHVGHAYGAEVLLAEQTDALEAALWTAVRTFRERAVLSKQLATHERLRGNAAGAARFEEQAAQATRYASLIVEHVLRIGDGPAPGEPENVPP
jgi:two-component system chemotaxis response regulator CheB